MSLERFGQVAAARAVELDGGGARIIGGGANQPSR